jgi:hypothetical protein
MWSGWTMYGYYYRGKLLSAREVADMRKFGR